MLPETDNILVVSLRRSGGKLVRRLLDGHPSIRALPIEHWHTAKKGRYPGPILKRFSGLSAAEKLAVTGFLRMTARKLDKVCGVEEGAAFMAELVEDAKNSLSAPELYERFVNRYFNSLCGVQDRKVVNHCGNLALMSPEELDQVFGPSTKIVIWRDPRAVYVSSKAARVRKRQAIRNSFVEDFCNEYQNAYDNYSRWPSGLTLQFESLVLDPRTRMQSLASALGLSFDDALLVPTIFGSPADANTSFDRTFGAIDAGAADDWRDRIEGKERRIIEERLGPVIHEHYKTALPKAA